MSKSQYSPQNFFRQAPNALLNRYFHEHNLLTSLDIASLGETDIEPIYKEWTELPAVERSQTEQDFKLIDLVADEQGIITLLEEARFHNENLEPIFATMSDFYEKAFWTFFEHHQYLEIAGIFCEADELPRHYWRDLNGIPLSNPRDDKAGCQDLADVLRLYFQQQQGRGYACQVDVLRRGAHYYYFAYPEDHSQSLIEFEGQENRLQRRVHRPVFEVIFVYDPEEGILSTYFEGRAAVVRDLQELFAREILIMNLPSPVRDQKVYELNCLKDRHFQFRYEPTSGIIDIKVRQLKLAILGGDTRRITLDVDPTRNREAVYDLMDDILNSGDPQLFGNRIHTSMVNITKVGITALFMPNGRRKKPTKTFYIAYPNSCSLKHDEKDLALRQMLIDSNIEPRKMPSVLLNRDE